MCLSLSIFELCITQKITLWEPDGVVKNLHLLWAFGHTLDILYAFTPAQTLCLIYEDFYLAINSTFYRFIIVVFSYPSTTKFWEGTNFQILETWQAVLLQGGLLFPWMMAFVQKHGNQQVSGGYAGCTINTQHLSCNTLQGMECT